MYLFVINVGLNERLNRTFFKVMTVILAFILIRILNIFTKVNVTWFMGLIIIGATFIGILLGEIVRKKIINKNKDVS
jgi:hypothetical protein